ncbi:hypothetical protein [Kibdelosporangium philippinense]|uniref:hypothetical protein n=1 Tax=Kibdelosporangium philippinense TaxID=211113 RepID=UPI003622ABAD
MGRHQTAPCPVNGRPAGAVIVPGAFGESDHALCPVDRSDQACAAEVVGDVLGELPGMRSPLAAVGLRPGG